MNDISNLTKEGALMTTNNDILINSANKVVNFLDNSNYEYVKFDDYTYTVTRGSSQVMIVVRPFTEDDCAVEFIANVVYETKINPDLMYYLLRKNSELHFGGFGLLFDDTVTFSYSVAGKNLDENEFIVALNSVAIIADYYDDEIIASFGGKRASDIQAEVE
jgi:hypothetical protein